MLELLLSATDGGTTWRHLLAEGEARAGFEQVGPLGLARRLGRILGVPAQPARPPTRLAAFALKLDRHDDGTRSYSASRRQDPFGVARFLLSLRDELRLAGFCGTPLQGSARLKELAELEAVGPELPSGLPDVLAALLDEVQRTGTLPFPLTIRLASPRAAFAPLVSRLLSALATAGATITDPSPDSALAPANSDLGRLQRALLDPAGARAELCGDGTLLLLEADTPVEAAELAASFTRGRSLPATTFVVSAEPGILDAALARQGLPTLGLASSSPLRPPLQLLPLRLALAFRPQEPFRAAELLLLPGAPLPGPVRRRLLEALGEMPGVGSPVWLEAIELACADALAAERAGGADEAAASAAAAALAEKIEGWFGGALHDPVTGIPALAAAGLCVHVARFAGGRLVGAKEAADAGTGSAEEPGLWSQAIAVAHTLEAMLVARPPGELLSQQTLTQLHDLAVGNGPELAAFSGEAGRPAVAGGPDAVVGVAAETVWWGFVQDADPGLSPEPWNAAEREALLAAELTLPAPGERRAVEAAGWRRPILRSRERVALVRWRLSGAEAVALHAFADELGTRIAPGGLAACTLDSAALLAGKRAPWAPATLAVAPDAPLLQRPLWKVPASAVAPDRTISSTSLDSFLGCPFSWALHYQAKLRPGRGVSLPEGDQLLGSFAHRILQDLLCGEDALDPATTTDAEAHGRAARAFDARVASEAAPLVRRGAEVELDRGRTVVANAAAALVRILRQGGFKAVDVEREVTGTFAGQAAAGSVDLVVEKDGREALIDLKLSGLKYRRTALEQGRALQLALYASMSGLPGGELPPSAFFLLRETQLLTGDPDAFPGGVVVEGPTARETLQGAEAGFAYWKALLAAGYLPVLHGALGWEVPVAEAGGPLPDEDGPARREPPCRFCDFSAVCVAGAEAA